MPFLLEISAVCLVGFVAGWLSRRAVRPVDSAAAATDRQAEPDQAKLAQRQSKNLLHQVQAITAQVAAQVGEHNVQVQAISDELTAADGMDQSVIMKAVARLVEVNAAMQQQLKSAEAKMDDQARTIECYISEARTDALTGISNRRAFDEELERCRDEHATLNRPTTVMLVDVDHFKKFNDTHGHKAGDEVLKAVAQKLKEASRGKYLVCRYGGEEFTVLLRGESLPGAVRAAERLRSAISAAAIDFEGKHLQVTASAGLAQFIGDELGERTVARADSALYCSKHAGRNQGHFHDGDQFVPFIAPSAVRPALAVAPPLAVANEPVGEAPAVATDEAVAAVANARKPAPVDHDPVTGLSAHNPFYDDLDRRLAEWRRGGPTVAVMKVQVDGWSDVVRKRGVGAGDLALKAVARLLQATVRDMDHVARYDEDSFGVLLPTAAAENALGIARRLQQALARCTVAHEGQPLPLSASIGITHALSDDNASRLLQRATAAQNNAANRGGQMIYIHDGSRLRLEEWQPVLA